jgi:hypothetical protein
MRPYELLPLPFPCDYDPGPEYFYMNFVSPLISDMITMMDTGLYVDDKAVESLRETITTVLENVDAVLLRNKTIQKYQLLRIKKAQKSHYAKCTEKTRKLEYYLKEYDDKSKTDRSFVVNRYLTEINRIEDLRDDWTVKNLKQYNVFKNDKFLSGLLNKTYNKHSEYIKIGMIDLATYKAELWNRPRYDKGNSTAPVDAFNPGSPQQKQELFAMLNIAPLAHSDTTGDGSWGREYIEELKKQTPDDRKELHEILQMLIDHSYGGIIRNNFLKAFDTFTIDGVMHGNVRLFGAKSFRPTSNSPNLLNAPSTKSIYAKPLKKCFVPPSDDYLVYAIDLNALEDRVIGNLSGDENKCSVFLEGIDGHSLNSCDYYKEEVIKILGDPGDSKTLVKLFMDEVFKENKIIAAIRQKSKPVTFKLAYGGYPDIHKGGVISQELFDAYHNDLYPGISDYRENYVLPQTKEDGFLHLGLGCRIYSDDPDGDIRTLHNASVQFWSILTLIAVNEMNHRIREAGLTNEIAICSTIYDSIYFYVKKDATCIKWLNDNAVEVLCMPYLENQVVPNDAEGEIGKNWGELTKVVKNSSIEDIEDVIKKLEKNYE